MSESGKSSGLTSSEPPTDPTSDPAFAQSPLGIDSFIIQSLGYLSFQQIFSKLKSGKAKYRGSQESIDERIRELLFVEGMAKPVQNVLVHQKITSKQNPFLPDEDYFFTFLRKHFPTRAPYVILERYRNLFGSQRPFRTLTMHNEKIQDIDPSYFAMQYATALSMDEAKVLTTEFTDEQMEECKVTEEMFNWWRDSLEPEEITTETVQTEFKPELSRDVQQLEDEMKFLMEADFSSGCLFKLQSVDGTISVGKKFAIIGTFPDCNIPVKSESDFRLMIRLCTNAVFYLENLSPEIVYVNGTEIQQEEVVCLMDNPLIEAGSLAFIFEPNLRLTHLLRQKLR